MPRAAGFTYLTVLFVIVIMGTGLALTGEVWHTAAVRDREAELLFAGSQYRKAIERYYLSGPPRYPRSLEELLKDPRRPGAERYLRKLYPDPITGSPAWGIVKAPDGGVMGVHSLSEERPLKSANFRVRDAAFEGAAKYADWKFVYAPGGAAAGKPPVQGGPAASPLAIPSEAPAAAARQRPPLQIPREPWVCEAARANELRACAEPGGRTAEAQAACRRQAAERYRFCIAGGVSAAAPEPPGTPE